MEEVRLGQQKPGEVVAIGGPDIDSGRQRPSQEVAHRVPEEPPETVLGIESETVRQLAPLALLQIHQDVPLPSERDPWSSPHLDPRERPESVQIALHFQQPVGVEVLPRLETHRIPHDSRVGPVGASNDDPIDDAARPLQDAERDVNAGLVFVPLQERRELGGLIPFRLVSRPNRSYRLVEQGLVKGASRAQWQTRGQLLLGKLGDTFQLQLDYPALSALFDRHTDVEILILDLHLGGPDDGLVVSAERVERLDIGQIINQYRVHQATATRAKTASLSRSPSRESAADR